MKVQVTVVCVVDILRSVYGDMDVFHLLKGLNSEPPVTNQPIV